MKICSSYEQNTYSRLWKHINIYNDSEIHIPSISCFAYSQHKIHWVINILLFILLFKRKNFRLSKNFFLSNKRKKKRNPFFFKCFIIIFISFLTSPFSHICVVIYLITYAYQSSYPFNKPYKPTINFMCVFVFRRLYCIIIYFFVTFL